MSRTALSVTSLISLLLALPFSVFGKAPSPARLSGSLPLAFEPNRGQTQANVEFVAHGNGYSVSLKSGGATIALHQRKAKEADVLRVRLLGSRPTASALGAAPLRGRSNYIRGRNPEGWIQDVPQFARVRRSTLKHVGKRRFCVSKEQRTDDKNRDTRRKHRRYFKPTLLGAVE